MFKEGDEVITLSNVVDGKTEVLFAKIIKDHHEKNGKVSLKWQGKHTFESTWEYDKVQFAHVRYRRRISREKICGTKS